MAVCFVFVTACSAHMQVAPSATPPGGEMPRVAVLPMVNMSGRPAPLTEIRQALIGRLIAQGAVVLDEGELERFMARHRVRYVGGIDTVTAQALMKETGMDSVLITVLEQYADARPPAIAVTSRLVATGDTPIIFWMETVGLSGDDSPGLLGMGLIDDISRLQEKALDRLFGSFARFLENRTGKGIGRGDRKYDPKTVYSSPFMRPGRKYAVAVAPFLNRSERNDADDLLALHFISQLTKAGTFDVLDPGAVREQLLFFRFIMQEGLSMRQADLLHNSLRADFILTGKVMEYEDGGGNPKVEFSVLVFERKRKKVVWESWSYNQGDDGVRFFDWGRVITAAPLATKMAQAVVRDMTALGTIQGGQRPEEPPSSRGPWENMRDDLPAR